MNDLQLRLFGGLQLLSGDGLATPRSGRARTLAIFALAAVGGPGGILRHRVISMLWPDSDQERGRNSLRQEIFNIRRDLGEQSVTADSDTVQLAPHVVMVDLWHFEQSIARGDHELAVSMYRGPFLYGFDIPGLGHFDRWIESQRARYHGMVMNSLDKLAEARCKEGDFAGLVECRTRRATLEPLSSRVALELIQALIAAEDRAAALQHARSHTQLIESELDARPDPTFLAYVEKIASS